MKLARAFFDRDAHIVAKELLGKLLVRETEDGTVKGRIVEVEVYSGTPESMDYACHAFPMKRTARTEVMFGEAGHAYVYLIYGMYSCLNLVCNHENVPECVLIRALEPVEGLDLMRVRRRQEKVAALCSGPGKLCQALSLTRLDNGLDLYGDALYVESDEAYEDIEGNDNPEEMTAKIAKSKRINIDYAKEAKDFLWRYTLKGNRYLSLKEK